MLNSIQILKERYTVKINRQAYILILIIQYLHYK